MSTRLKKFQPTTIQGYLKYAMLGIAMLVVAGLQSEHMSMLVIFGAFVLEVVLAAFVLYFDYVEDQSAEEG